MIAGVATLDSAPVQPHKRPRQRRSRFTILAIYDAFVRIWSRDGPAAATMRNVATESGFAIGTLYEYFPNVDALLLGYARHLADTALARLDAELERTEGSWTERLHRFICVCCDFQATGYCDDQMLQLESSLARRGDYTRFFAKLERRWIALVESWDGPRPERAQVAAIALAVWGARYFRQRLGEVRTLDGWVDQLCRQCELAWKEA
ncbi:transcriptional regulator, TetR family [Variovorax sp. YR752]|nr:transcriptional regulator, TetR family [Variovorax sp. YR752]